MAQRSAESRYYLQPRSFRLQFGEGDTHGDEPLSIDQITGRRSTTWGEPASAMKYTVQAGDTIHSLADKFLKDQNRWWRIADVNPQIFYPLEDLAAGQEIIIPLLEDVGEVPGQL